jgi:hypothetical protein
VAACEVIPQERAAAGSSRAAVAAKFVKVPIDGVPYMRKVNLQDYAGDDQLLHRLAPPHAPGQVLLPLYHQLVYELLPPVWCCLPDALMV